MSITSRPQPNWPASPDQPLRCLMIQPLFRAENFWNMGESTATTGAKTMAPPLGLLTVAAILPQHWDIKLVDYNVREMTDEEWHWADVILTGGMIPQQLDTLELIERAQQDGKYIVVGGPDPTSQPEIYESADALVVGEGEASIPVWLDSWRNGNPSGLFEVEDRPDIKISPTPRFDLINFKDYFYVGIQLSRGCPFNCEFCDIIELYGRIPRSKSVEQVIAELERMYQLGHRGWVDIADDNFIGNKKFVKTLLVELDKWCKKRKYPFYFSTEASMNLADDDNLLELMRAVDFRVVFMGIETPDPELLAVTQKRMNALKPVVERVHHVYEYGISISAGFIVGFDNEKPGVADSMIACIEESGIIMSMVGLLVALPNTQLTRRLMKEGRMIDASTHEVIPPSDEPYRLVNHESADNTSGGINYITTRDRADVYEDYRRVITTVFAPKNYFRRVYRTTKLLKPVRKQVPSPAEAKKMVAAFFRIVWWMTCKKETRWLYWSNTLRTMFMGPAKFEFCQSMMATYMHLGKQSARVDRDMKFNIDYAKNHAKYPRLVVPNPLPILSGVAVEHSTCSK